MNARSGAMPGKLQALVKLANIKTYEELIA